MNKLAAQYCKSAMPKHGKKRAVFLQTPIYVIEGEPDMIHVANGAFLFIEGNSLLKLNPLIDTRMFAFKKEDDPWEPFYKKGEMKEADVLACTRHMIDRAVR